MSERPVDFIRALVESDLQSGKHQRVITRFPPEPNGYLHMGHAKSICLNFGLAKEHGGACHLRFDDTNPLKEDPEYVEGIKRDVQWLGFDWDDKLFAASDYFGQMYDFAVELVQRGKAFVCEQSEAEMRATRGTVTEAGTPSPWRDRSVEDNLTLLQKMRDGEIDESKATLRAKIDMAHANMKMRDPAIYRIRKVTHHAAGAWNIYPLYDFAHCLSDAIEGITHSICTLEFENNRGLYDWYLDNVTAPCHPQQIEFARLNLTWTVMSKRFLLKLVQDGRVTGWDDPRMPTLAGMRRRGVPPEALRAFCEEIGVAKTNSTVELEKYEHVLRETLNAMCPRVMVVANPLPITLEGIDADRAIEAPLFPGEEGSAARTLTLGSRIFIDRDDFALDPPKGWHRLTPDQPVRLRHAGILRVTGVEQAADGTLTGLRGRLESGEQKVKGTIHWVNANGAVPVTLRLYERLFVCEKPGGDDGDFLRDMNPNSLSVVTGLAEPHLATAAVGDRFQFERVGYFAKDPDSQPGAPVFNRVIGLKDSFAKEPRAEAPRKGKVEAKAPAAPVVEQALDPAAAALVSRGLGAPEARRIAGDAPLEAFFAAATGQGASDKAIGAWLVNELLGKGGPAGVSAAAFATLVARVESGAISAPSGKALIADLLAGAADIDALIAARGLAVVTDTGAIDAAIDQVLAKNEAALARYRGGETQLLGFFVGQVMRAAKGADPKLVSARVSARLLA